MAYAFSLLPDAELADAVVTLWERLADAGLSRSMLDLGYQPHVTLAVFDELDVKGAVAALDETVSHIARLAVTLNAVTTFGAASGVCYASLAPSSDLVGLHQMVLSAMVGSCRPHYQVGSWTPHCTLAVNLFGAELDRARDLLDRDWQSINGTFDTAELVEFAPVVSIKRWRLNPSPRSTHMP